jgi:hypothetical protein
MSGVAVARRKKVKREASDGLATLSTAAVGTSEVMELS